MNAETNTATNDLLSMIDAHYKMDGKRRKDTPENKWLEDFHVQFSRMLHLNRVDFSKLESERDELKRTITAKDLTINNGDILLEKAIAEREFALGRIEELEADAKFMDSEVMRLTNEKVEATAEAKKWEKLHKAKNEHMTTNARAEKTIRKDMESAIKQCQKAMEVLATLKYEQSPEH